MKPYTLGLYEKAMPLELSWREKLLIAKAAGYDFIEMSIDETEEKLARLDMSWQERKDLLCLMAEISIPIRTMCLSGHRKFPLGSSQETVAERGMEIMEKAIYLAEDLGIQIIQLAGYDVYYEASTAKTKRRFAENLQRSVMMAAARGIILGFETMETEFMNTVEKAMNYVELINSPYLHVYPDSGNLKNAAVTYGRDVVADLNNGNGRLVAIHLKETLPEKFREIPFGTGHVNFQEIIHIAWRLGVRRYVTEFWYIGNLDWQKDIWSARKMMGDLLDMEGANNLLRKEVG